MARAKAARLLSWYDRHRRELPWRAGPGVVADPYHVWLSEIMLQQTNVTTVKPYFARFLHLWPTVHALAKAPREQVMEAWAGLGYYARARNLHACAKMVSEELGGIFPQDREGLLSLPGVGPYTAGAIAAIAFDAPEAAVDGNVERVITRAFRLETPLPEVKPQVREITQSLVPQKRAGDFAQALMDLGSEICTPKKPACALCPWLADCEGRDIAETLPRRKAKKPVPERFGIAFWIERADGALLLRRRPEKGLLGGMMEMPSAGWSGDDAAFSGTDTGLAVTHVFTHFRLTLAIHKAKAPAKLPGPGYEWVARRDLFTSALPSVMLKAVKAVVMG